MMAFKLEVRRLRAESSAQMFSLQTGRRMSHMLDIQSLTKRFGAITAVDGVSFVADRGEVVGFLGPNGSGKTTTMRMIVGYLTPSVPGMRWFAVTMSSRSRLRSNGRVGYLPEGAPLYAER